MVLASRKTTIKVERYTSYILMSALAPKQTTSEPTQAPSGKVKPCCVCKAEKQERDECLLFNSQESGKCDGMITQYKECMKGYGFTI